jgi:MFS family permease
MKRKSLSRFLILWTGQLFSSLGTGMTAFALGVHVFSETLSAAGFAGVILALFLPSILLRPLGGVLADRFDRRMLILLGDMGSAAGVVFILICLRDTDLVLWQIYLGVSWNSAFGALQNPAYKASVSDLLTEEQFSRAGGLLQLAAAAQHLLSPLAAGFLLATTGLEAVLLLDIASFIPALAGAFALPAGINSIAGARSRRIGSGLREGVAALTAQPEVLKTVMALSLVTFFVGVLQTLFAPMMLSLTDAKTLGFVQSVSASGMLICSLFIGLFGLPARKEVLIPLSLAAAGLFLALMGISSGIAWITVSFFLFFVTLPLINTSAEVLIRSSIATGAQGRAWGIIGLLSQAGYIIAYLSSGLLADAVFNPMLLPGGLLARSAGRIVGTGPGRGIGLMLILSGLGLALTAGLYAPGTIRIASKAVHKGAHRS